MRGMDESVNNGFRDWDVFAFCNVRKTRIGRAGVEGRKTEFGTARCKGFDDSGDVVANEAESGYPCICFHYTAECTLGVLGHRVGFVENDNFVRWTRICFPIRGDGLCSGCLASKVLDFLPNDADSTLVRRVQLQHSVLKIIWSGARIRRPIKE